MIEIQTTLGTARIMQASVDGIPDLRGANVFADVETTSFDDKVEAFHPYNGHRICGYAVTFDDMEGAWYFPTRHRGWDNYDPRKVVQLIKGKRWINHNVKFDQHFTWQDGHEFDGEYQCTVVLSKLIDTDRMSHELKPLCREYGMPMEEEEQVKGYLESCKSVDYGRVPADILGRYACMDVMGNRNLYNILKKKLEVPYSLWQMEKDLTPVLFRMERRGLKVNQRQCKIELRKSLSKMIMAAEHIEKETGLAARAGPNFAYDLICGHLGLPILKRVKKDDGSYGGPSFNKEAMALYDGHPDVVTDPKKRALIDSMRTYRSEGHWKGLFAESFLEKMTPEGLIHPSYNQVVRTGRMSCKNPNSQQMNSRAKSLIAPRGVFCSTDASQIEFRVIAHYMKDPDVLAAYNENANTDFHSWVAELCAIDRKPAKTINFSMAFGAGKKKILTQLMSNKDIMKRFACDDPREYERLCRQWAVDAYTTYHQRLPGIKRIMGKAESKCRRRGYSKGLYGRRRHLPMKIAHIAGNTVVQGSASDFIKRRMIEVDRYDPDVLVAAVHDELLAEGSEERMMDPQFKKDMKEILEVSDGLRVPVAWDWGHSDVSWAKAGA